MQKSVDFSHKATKEVCFPYLVYTPEGYNKAEEKLPLIIFLHGSGERGEDTEKLKCHGIPKIFDGPVTYRCVAVSPQCPENSFWIARLESLKVFVDEIIKEYCIDEKRVYLTGLSMGGYGAWHLAMAYPEMFAALVPVCGGGMPWNAEVIKGIPVWAFHGVKDDVVLADESIRMVNAVNNTGGNARITLYSDADHDSWTRTYNNPELYEWMFANIKK